MSDKPSKSIFILIDVTCARPILLTTPTGVVSSPLHEVGHVSYPCDLNCGTYISVDGAESITLTFSDFDVTRASQTKYELASG